MLSRASNPAVAEENYSAPSIILPSTFHAPYWLSDGGIYIHSDDIEDLPSHKPNFLKRWISGGVAALTALSGGFALAGDLDPSSEAKIEPAYISGDSNIDGQFNLADIVHSLEFMFLNRGQSLCQAAMDINGDNSIDIGDPLRGLFHLYVGGPKPSGPFPLLGIQPENSTLSCDIYLTDLESRTSSVIYQILRADTLAPISGAQIGLTYLGRSLGDVTTDSNGKSTLSGLALSPQSQRKYRHQIHADGYFKIDGDLVLKQTSQVTLFMVPDIELEHGGVIFPDVLEALTGNGHSTGFVINPHYMIPREEALVNGLILDNRVVCTGISPISGEPIYSTQSTTIEDYSPFIQVVNITETGSIEDDVEKSIAYIDHVRTLRVPQEMKKFTIGITTAPMLEGSLNGYEGTKVFKDQIFVNSGTPSSQGWYLRGQVLLNGGIDYDFDIALKEITHGLSVGGQFASEAMNHPVYNLSHGVNPQTEDERLIEQIKWAKTLMGMKPTRLRGYQSNYKR